jgi:hypothetical protein
VRCFAGSFCVFFDVDAATSTGTRCGARPPISPSRRRQMAGVGRIDWAFPLIGLSHTVITVGWRIQNTRDVVMDFERAAADSQSTIRRWLSGLWRVHAKSQSDRADKIKPRGKVEA